MFRRKNTCVKFICSISSSAYDGLHTFSDMHITKMTFRRAGVLICMIKEGKQTVSQVSFERLRTEKARVLSQEPQFRTEEIYSSLRISMKLIENTCHSLSFVALVKASFMRTGVTQWRTLLHKQKPLNCL